jgi:hypothetical protein
MLPRWSGYWVQNPAAAWQHTISFVVSGDSQTYINVWALEACFISRPKIPTSILNFFQNESNRLRLLFLHNKLDNFTNKILSHVNRLIDWKLDLLNPCIS